MTKNKTETKIVKIFKTIQLLPVEFEIAETH